EMRTRDAHLVEIGVRRERLEAGMLIFPPEAPETRHVVGFEHRHHDRGAAQLGGLGVADREQRLVGNTLDKAGTERDGRDPERTYVVLERDALDDVGVRRGRMDQRAAERLEEAARGVESTGAVLGDLAGSAGDDVLM